MSNAADTEVVLEKLREALNNSVRSSADIKQLLALVQATTSLIDSNASSLDVKISSSALQEMTAAFEMFAPYRHVPKVTIFGSARTTADNPIYAQTVAVAQELASRGFMVVTGAGPGIMEAGMVGAGREKSIGVSINLPFETGANTIISGDEKYVSMRYFFTRKLLLIKESQAFLCLPGGFGTLDETFELLTLAQTAKSVPVPIVFLEIPGAPFWTPIMNALTLILLEQGLISESDTTLYTITNSVEAAVSEITTFYKNFHSIRFVGNTLYLRIQRAIPADDFAALVTAHASITTNGTMFQAMATSVERKDNDHVDLHRIGLKYSAKGFADLRPLINAINQY